MNRDERMRRAASISDLVTSGEFSFRLTTDLTDLYTSIILGEDVDRMTPPADVVDSRLDLITELVDEWQQDGRFRALQGIESTYRNVREMVEEAAREQRDDPLALMIFSVILTDLEKSRQWLADHMENDDLI